MRRYLLLGQGDFVQHLMDLLQYASYSLPLHSLASMHLLSLSSTELSQAASSLYLHNLTAVLESAVRATNAQYDDQDVLNRLDVKMLDVSLLSTRTVHALYISAAVTRRQRLGCL